MHTGGRAGLHSGAGFTLVELVAVLALVGILAMVALPRFFSAASHSGRGHGDLRYAQRLPIARQGRIHVQVEGDTLSLA